MAQLGPTTVLRPGLWGYGGIQGFPLTADISSPFGPRTPILTPAGLTSDFHTGIDLPAAGGTLILCPADDLLITAEGPALTGYGNCVFGSTPDGYQLLFAHMQPGLHAGVGQRLRRGDLVGQVGTTGASTGNHLHFGVMLPGAPQVVDVNTWLAPGLFTDPMWMFTDTITSDSIVIQPQPVDNPMILDFISNSLAALAANPPDDLGAALTELGKRVEYLRGLLG